MFLEIITPEKKIYEGEVKRVRLPGSKGLFEMLKNHAPLISTLRKGTIRVIDENDRRHTFEVTGGVVENKDNNVIVLAESD
ncbi:ATP synthase F1 subunit epsilon [Mariniphaga sediminis]|jgi:F-type H+-transporting ATPase subunit epsilon|uniref:ATP synthase F1 subunit epsilon n=1 Tax=Mariniphaga sediminis TaxID=1628158 RepID=A0A399D0E6_9BACT|nr:ATP synthase F1 subunit epsilon [Mariniphaga sediminis]MBD3620756.1 ATP synthase F1 subunit epsilon [Sunxiuqinia sp.]RIH64668.1 ATP synthase F1 subunit epsilon [Mariniphaga sediminis]